jgi:dihydropyrimidinase
MRRLIVRGGTVVNATGMEPADVWIARDKIVAITRTGDPRGLAGQVADADVVVDARGMFVLPGLVDPHVHFELPFMGTFTRHDFYTGTIAAAFGGVTSVIDFAFQERGRPALEAVRARQSQAKGKACIDYSFHAIFTDVQPETPRELEPLLDAGIGSWKVFMAYRRLGIMVDDGGLYALLEASHDLPVTGIVHAENPYLIEYLVDRYLAQGKSGARYHALSRPPLAEAEAVARAARLAGAASSSLYIFHVSSADAVAEVRAARARGWPVYAETCPHYLLLDASLYDRPDGHNWCMSPPLRAQVDRDALWQAVADGTISAVTTDDAAFDAESKAAGKDSFDKIPNGVPGVESRLALMYSEGVCKGRIDLPRLVALTSTNPARITGLYPRKGQIAVGADADLVVLDPARRHTLSVSTSRMRTGWHPYEGMAVTGQPVMTIARGEVIVANDTFKGRAGRGRFVDRRVDPALKRGPIL